MWEADSPLTGQDEPVRRRIYIADAARLSRWPPSPTWGSRTRTPSTRSSSTLPIALLEQQKPLVAEYWGDVVKQGQGIANGTVDQSQGWQLTANIANADGEKVGT